MKKKIVALGLLAILMISLIPVALAACNHSYAWVVTKAATCSQTGTKVRKCTKCGTVSQTSAIPKTAHNWTPYTVVKAATCQQEGQQRSTCKNCGAVRTQPIAKRAHNFQFVRIVTNPTCTTAGRADYKCQWCPMHDYRAIPATGHNFVNNKCTKCGMTK